MVTGPIAVKIHLQRFLIFRFLRLQHLVVLGGPQPSTSPARPCAASGISRDRACSGWRGRFFKWATLAQGTWPCPGLPGEGRERAWQREGAGGGLQVTGHLVSLGLQPASPPRGLSLLLPLGPSLGAESRRFLSPVTGQSSRLPGCLVCLVCVVGGGAGLPLCRFGDAGCSWTPSSPSSASGPWSLGLCGLLPAWRGPRNGRRGRGVGGAR